MDPFVCVPFYRIFSIFQWATLSSLPSLSRPQLFLSLCRCFKDHLIEVIYVFYSLPNSLKTFFSLVANRKSFQCLSSRPAWKCVCVETRPAWGFRHQQFFHFPINFPFESCFLTTSNYELSSYDVHNSEHLDKEDKKRKLCTNYDEVPNVDLTA